jgi:hypothetical protein
MKTTGSDGDGPCIENGSCNPDPPGPPSCSLDVTAKVAAGSWRGAGTVATSTDSQWTATSTQLIVVTRDGAWPIGDVYECSHLPDLPHCEIAVTAAKAVGGGLEVTATYKHDDATTKLTYVCTSSPVSCDER